MLEYLVRNHLYGNYYVTTGNPDDIEALCEQCFDRDEILASWEKGDKEEEYNAILPYCYEGAYLVSSFDTEEENYKAWLEESFYDEFDLDLVEDITDSFEGAREIASYLEKNKDIDSDLADKLKEAISLREKLWHEISKTFDYSLLENSKYKVLKKVIN